MIANALLASGLNVSISFSDGIDMQRAGKNLSEKLGAIKDKHNIAITEMAIRRGPVFDRSEVLG